MKILEYLQSKYDVQVPTTMTKIEAMAFGIRFPLQSGWLAKHGQRHIDFSDLKKLQGKMERRLESQKNAGKRVASHTQEGLVVLRKLEKSIPTVKIPTAEQANSDAFLISFEWKQVRLQAFKKYGNRCQCCGASPDTGAVMNVDHIKPRRIFPQLALDINNLQVLCGACNHGKGNWDMTDWRTEEQKSCS